MKTAPLPITMLFIPGTEQEKFAKIPRLPARAFILDLEDAVPPAEKAASRDLVAGVIGEYGSAARLHVRVNPADGPHLVDDLEAVIRPGLTGINLPKATSAADIQVADRLIECFERRAGLPTGAIEIMATVETVQGIRQVFEIAAASPRLKRLCFGAGDFSLDVGVDWPHEDGVSGETLLFAKSQLVLASRLAGLEPPHDSVYPRYDDLDALRREAVESRRLGFLGKHAIHPAQLPVIEEVYRPSDRQVERARRMVAAFDEAEAQGRGAVGVDGELVDYPILYRARDILAEAEEAREAAQVAAGKAGA